MTTEYIIEDFQNNKINAINEEQQELFIHNYEPVYVPLDLASAFVLLDQEFQFVVKKYDSSGTGESISTYESVERESPIIIDSPPDGSGGSFSTSIIDFQLSEQENEVISYAKPVQFQISIDEEITSAQRNYINSISRREIEFNMLSSLGSITSEDTVTDSTTTGTTTELTTTTETITDVGGIITGGY